MTAPLLEIAFPSIYKVHGDNVPLPKRMAFCTPDAKKALFEVAGMVEQQGGRLRLSDLFRSYDMQLQAHLDYVTKKKTAYSPAPGASLHEAGRAFDIDLAAIRMPLNDFWKIAAAAGVVPIIPQPDSSASEAWHFECRGSHQLLYNYYEELPQKNFESAYQAMAASAILSAGIKVDQFADCLREARLQSALIRLGHSVGNMDGNIGPKTRSVLAALGLEGQNIDIQLEHVENALQKQFPGEYFDSMPFKSQVFS